MKIKSSIGFNTAIIANGINTDFAPSVGLGAAPTTVMMLFSGTVPTAAQLLAAADTITGQIKYDTLVANSTGRQLLAYCCYKESLIPEVRGPDHIVFPLTKAEAQGLVVNEGTPTWFVFGAVKSTATGILNKAAATPETVSGVKLGFTVMGTVGNESSNADMKIVGGAITSGAPYKFLDLDVTLNSPV